MAQSSFAEWLGRRRTSVVAALGLTVGVTMAATACGGLASSDLHQLAAGAGAAAAGGDPLDHLVLPDGRLLRLGDPIGPVASALDAVAAPLYQLPAEGTTVVFVLAPRGRVAAIVITPDDTVDRLEAEGVRPGIGIGELEAKVDGLGAARVLGEQALVRPLAGGGAAYFFEARRFGGPDQCSPTGTVGTIALAESEEALSGLVSFGCDPGVDYD